MTPPLTPSYWDCDTAESDPMPPPLLKDDVDDDDCTNATKNSSWGSANSPSCTHLGSEALVSTWQ